MKLIEDTFHQCIYMYIYFMYIYIYNIYTYIIYIYIRLEVGKNNKLKITSES